MIVRCGKCKRTFDMAIFAPAVERELGRELTDREVEDLDAGLVGWHMCLPTGDFTEEDRPQQARTQYDWRTHGKGR